jgi:hypothetical protein
MAAARATFWRASTSACGTGARASTCRASSGIDCFELPSESDGVLWLRALKRADGPQRAYRRTEQRYGGEEDERFLFGGRWHARSYHQSLHAVQPEYCREAQSNAPLFRHERHRHIAHYL